jgi:pSer/pThr/pTyr-binding forkhead associated (FHA) protein
VTQSRSSSQDTQRERPKGGGATVRRSPKSRSGAGRRGFILTITDGRNAGREYFFESEASLGRTDENNVIITDSGVSRRHARIVGGEGIFTIEDQGGPNGTRLNGERLTSPEVLRDGDCLQIGETTLLFSILDVAHEEVTGRTSFAELEEALADRSSAAERPSWQARLEHLVRSRAALAVVLAALLLSGGYGVWVVLHSGQAGIIIDRSSEVIAYSDGDDFFNRVFGYGLDDQAHREKVQVEFEYLGGRATLEYGAWGIDKVGELQVSVNGQKVSDTPLTLGRWVYGLKVVLPRKLLTKGAPNRVVFIHASNPPGKDTWEIGSIQILQETLPPADREEARLLFDRAKQAFADREIAPSNLYTALAKFRKARDLLEELPQKPEIYVEILEHIEKTDQLLTQKFQDALIDARRAEHSKGADESKQVLRQTLGFFDKEDFRYREIKRQLDAMGP